jgi:hypothetical protein
MPLSTIFQLYRGGQFYTMKDIYSSQKLLSYGLSWGCRPDRMVVGLITTYAISAYHH